MIFRRLIRFQQLQSETASLKGAPGGADFVYEISPRPLA